MNVTIVFRAAGCVPRIVHVTVRFVFARLKQQEPEEAATSCPSLMTIASARIDLQSHHLSVRVPASGTGVRVLLRVIVCFNRLLAVPGRSRYRSSYVHSYSSTRRIRQTAHCMLNRYRGIKISLRNACHMRPSYNLEPTGKFYRYRHQKVSIYSTRTGRSL